MKNKPQRFWPGVWGWILVTAGWIILVGLVSVLISTLIAEGPSFFEGRLIRSIFRFGLFVIPGGILMILGLKWLRSAGHANEKSLAALLSVIFFGYAQSWVRLVVSNGSMPGEEALNQSFISILLSGLLGYGVYRLWVKIMAS